LKDSLDNAKRYVRQRRKLNNNHEFNLNLELITDDLIDEKNNEDIINFIEDNKNNEIQETTENDDCLMLIDPLNFDRFNECLSETRNKYKIRFQTINNEKYRNLSNL
jgi:Mg/Co/Ni transporter MgtE